MWSKGIKGCSFFLYRPDRDMELKTDTTDLKKYTKLELVTEGVRAYNHSCHGEGVFIPLDKIRNNWCDEVSISFVHVYVPYFQDLSIIFYFHISLSAQYQTMIERLTHLMRLVMATVVMTTAVMKRKIHMLVIK